jgi:hypothetical protein
VRPGDLCSEDVRTEDLLQERAVQVVPRQYLPAEELLRPEGVRSGDLLRSEALRSGDLLRPGSEALRSGDLCSEAVLRSGPGSLQAGSFMLRFDLRAQDLLQGTLPAPLPQGSDLLRFDVRPEGLRPCLLRCPGCCEAGSGPGSYACRAAARSEAPGPKEGLVEAFFHDGFCSNVIALPMRKTMVWN